MDRERLKDIFMVKTNWLDSILNGLVVIGGKVAAYCILAATLMITSDVLARYLLGAGTKWVVEYTGYLVVAIVFLGLAYVQKDHEHALVDFVLTKLSRKIQRWVTVIGLIMFLAYSVFLGLFSWQTFIRSFSLQITSRTAVDVPLWPYQLMIPLGLALLSLRLMHDVAIAIQRRDRNVKEGGEEALR
jgi:C4-dicarboxylate transporter, DctQ subunit